MRGEVGYLFFTGCRDADTPLLAKYLYRKVTQKLLLQLQQTRDLAALTQEAGPTEMKEWLEMDIDDHALNPVTYHTRSPKKSQSVYILDVAKRKRYLWDTAMYTH